MWVPFNVISLAMNSPPRLRPSSAASSTAIQRSYNAYFVFGKGRLSALRHLRGQASDEGPNASSPEQTADISMMLVAETLSGAEVSLTTKGVTNLGSEDRKTTTRGPTKLSRATKIPSALSGLSSKQPVRSMESVVDDLLARVKQAWEGDGLAFPTNQPEGTIETLSRTIATLKALSQCVPRLEGVLSEIMERLERAQRFVEVSSEDLFSVKTQLREAEAGYQAKVEEANYRCTREVQRLTADWEKKEKDLDVLHRVCEGLKGRVDAAESTRKGTADRLHGAELMSAKGRVEVTQLRSKLSEMERKASAIIAENQYLRTIADHNARLLIEVQRLEERLQDTRRGGNTSL